MPVDRMIADIARFQAPDSVGETATGKTGAERTGKHLRIERQDGGAECHGRRLEPIAARPQSLRPLKEHRAVHHGTIIMHYIVVFGGLGLVDEILIRFWKMSRQL